MDTLVFRILNDVKNNIKQAYVVITACLLTTSIVAVYLVLSTSETKAITICGFSGLRLSTVICYSYSSCVLPLHWRGNTGSSRRSHAEAGWKVRSCMWLHKLNCILYAEIELNRSGKIALVDQVRADLHVAWYPARRKSTYLICFRLIKNGVAHVFLTFTLFRVMCSDKV